MWLVRVSVGCVSVVCVSVLCVKKGGSEGEREREVGQRSEDSFVRLRGCVSKHLCLLSHLTSSRAQLQRRDKYLSWWGHLIARPIPQPPILILYYLKRLDLLQLASFFFLLLSYFCYLCGWLLRYPTWPPTLYVAKGDFEKDSPTSVRLWCWN